MDKQKERKLWFGLAILFLFLFAAVHFSSLAEVISAVGAVMFPVLMGFGIAFVLNLPLRRCERHWIRRFGKERRVLRRAVCLLLCFGGMVAVLVLLAFIIFPTVWQTIGTLIARLPEYAAEIGTWWNALSDFLTAHSFPVSLPPFTPDSQGIRSVLEQYWAEHGSALMGASVGFAKTALIALLDVVVALFIAVYLLAQKERLGAGVTKMLYGFFSEKTAARILNFGRLCGDVFSRFITGQVTEAVILGSLCFVGMLIFRMPYALLISLLVGVTALIPIFGAFIGTGIGAFLLLLEDPVKAIWFVVFIVVLQQVEGNLIYPKVVGKSVGLPGLWVLIAVTIGSSFGVVGMLLSVPLASVGYTLLRQFVNSRCAERQKDVVGENGESKIES